MKKYLILIIIGLSLTASYAEASVFSRISSFLGLDNLGDTIRTISPFIYRATNLISPISNSDTVIIGSTSTSTNDIFQVVGSSSISGNLRFDGEIMPDGATCSDGQILKRTGANDWDCSADATGGGGGGVSTSTPFSAGYIPFATSSSAITDSNIFQSGSNIGIGTTTPGYKLSVNGDIEVQNSGIHYINTNSWTADTADWIKLGRFSANSGATAVITIGGGLGYNGDNSQNALTTIFLRYSNGGSGPRNISGWFHRYGMGNSIQQAKVKSVNTTKYDTAYDIYVYAGPYTGYGFYKVDLNNTNGVWAHSGTSGQTNPGSESDYVGILTDQFYVYSQTSIAGNVGIGTATPNQKLDVAGDILINGLTIGRGGGLIPSNTANGAGALVNNTTGSYNTANGASVLVNNTSGNYNTANGLNALYNNTSGNYNTANGASALRFNTTGDGNTANGITALYFNTTGDNNTANGANALYDNTIGNNNTVIGYSTGRGITTGSNNTIIGANVGSLPAILSNNIIIADGSGNRRINVDSSGNVGIGTTTPISTLQIGSLDTAYSYTQIDATSTPTASPPAADCNVNAHLGKMFLMATTTAGANRLYVCSGATNGWDYLILTD